MSQKQFFIPIAIKLITIISMILLISLGATTIIITNVIQNDVRITAENNNYALNQHAASEAEIFFNTIITNTTLIINMLSATQNSAEVEALFDTNSIVAGVIIPKSTQNHIDEVRLLNKNFFYTKGIDAKNIDAFLQKYNADLSRVQKGETLLLNASPLFESNILALCMPLVYQNEEKAAVALFCAESLTDTFGSGTNKAMLINAQGDILVSSVLDDVLNAKSIKEEEVFAVVNANNTRQRQLVYKGADGFEYFTSFHKLLGGEAIVITQIQDELVFEALNIATRRNFYLTLTVLFVAILFVWYFSKTISNPIEFLREKVAQIKNGNFAVATETNTHDELALLGQSIHHMKEGLKERERLKETFGKFINSEIAERAAKGELTLGGESKEVTVFFTDLRSFTAFADGLNPKDVVAFLNNYLEIMVQCISDNNGSVDKFIGDAIMAVWGAPLAMPSAKEGALCAIKTALLMRYRLLAFNEERKKQNLLPVHMGCGINSGTAVAGQIGSHERMEYTVIGDTVNLASRIEAINKPLATDILLGEATYNLVKDEVIVEEMPSVTVKGKNESIRLFALIGLKNAKGTILQKYPSPKTLKEVQKLVGIPKSDFVASDINEEEKKYEIQN